MVPQLVTNYKFAEGEFLIKMFIDMNQCLELTLLNNITKDEWRGLYNDSYIENMTQKTGNYKLFNIFITMLRAGLLRTSDCITLELLTFKNLKDLCLTKNYTKSERINVPSELNKRYLILTYTVEFDEIHYPLPLEYVGPPDPIMQQKIIYKLESRLKSIKQILQNGSKESVIVNKLKMENKMLLAENTALKHKIKAIGSNAKTKKTMILQKALKDLERGVLIERATHHRLVQNLRLDNTRLKEELAIAKRKESILMTKLSKIDNHKMTRPKNEGREHVSRKKVINLNNNNITRSRSCSESSNFSRKSVHTSGSARKSKSCSGINSKQSNCLEKSGYTSNDTISSLSIGNKKGSFCSSNPNNNSRSSRSRSLENISKTNKLKSFSKPSKRSHSIEVGIKNLQSLIDARDNYGTNFPT